MSYSKSENEYIQQIISELIMLYLIQDYNHFNHVNHQRKGEFVFLIVLELRFKVYYIQTSEKRYESVQIKYNYQEITNIDR